MPTGICEQDNIDKWLQKQHTYSILHAHTILALNQKKKFSQVYMDRIICDKIRIIMFDKITRTQFCWTFCSPLLSQIAGRWFACYSQCTGSAWEELVSSKYWSRIHSYASFVYEKTVKSNINNLSGITYSTMCILATIQIHNMICYNTQVATCTSWTRWIEQQQCPFNSSY